MQHQRLCPESDTTAGAAEDHADKMYRFKPRYAKVNLGIKLAGVHWCSKSLGHAAELTAGYYHTAHHNGYKPIMQMLAKHDAQVCCSASYLIGYNAPMHEVTHVL